MSRGDREVLAQRTADVLKRFPLIVAEMGIDDGDGEVWTPEEIAALAVDWDASDRWWAAAQLRAGSQRTG
jgi:hypothetical protein